ncbi:MAG: pseudouridylate synthase [Myxococcales bacterium]|nr:pseudouridylate synthase [Myxococcales bacterium]MCB9526031.1 pseudouridylate synthase [Myxococcales bacterium]
MSAVDLGGVDSPFRLLHRDARLVVIRKPPGWAVHRSDQARSGPFVLPALRDALGTAVFPVHRLDRPTAGALVLALDTDAQRALSAAFAERRVAKTYQAVVRGWPVAQVVDRPLRPLGGGDLQAAETAVHVLAVSEQPWPVGRFPSARFARLRCEPATGRWHQIRRHLAGIGHPIIGDVRHGDRHHNHLVEARLDLHRLGLWACELVLPHPDDGRPLRVTCPADRGLHRLLAGLGLGV